MNKTLSKFRKYRATIAADGVRPITFTEWILGRMAGHLEVRAATMATKRGDNATLNYALLALWAGNQGRGRHNAVASLEPAELNRAIKDGRVRIVIDEPATTTAAKH